MDKPVLNILTRWIHPAAVNCPVSASLVGRSSHVKLSVKFIARSILRCWSLRQKKTHKREYRVKFGSQPKNLTKIFNSCCENVSKYALTR